MLELGVTFSFAQLVIDNEIAGMVKRVVQGINVSDDTLAVELIKRVGSEKDYLAEKHTRQYMKSEQSGPGLIDRRMRGNWFNRGGKDLAEVASEKALRIIQNHEPAPLSPEVLLKLRSIVENAENE